MEHIQVEEQLISILLRDKEAIKKWSQSNADINKFDKIHTNIIAAIEYAHNNDVKLTRDTFKSFLSDYRKLTPAEVAAQISLFSRCYMKAAKKDDLPSLIDRVKLNHVRRKTSEFLRDYTKDREKLGDIGANRALVQKMQGLEAESAESKATFIESSSIKDKFMADLMDRRNNPNVRLSCGIKEIDETMNVGFKEGHLTIFCAPIGGFKTTMMVNVAANLFEQQGVNVLYIPLEMPYEEIYTKLVARETGISLEKIEHAEKLTEEEIQQISDSMERWKNLSHRFNVLDMAERTKVSILKNEIEKRINYFKPRVVFVDYVDNLIPDHNRGRSDLDMNDMLEDLRKMGKTMGFAVVSAAQLAKDFLKQFKEEKEGKQSAADTTSIRGGLVYSANADTVYAQVRDPTLPNERLIFMCIKARHGKPTFGLQNNVKAHLSVRPEIALIESPNEVTWADPNDNGLLDMLQSQPSSTEVEEESDSPF